MTNQKQNSVLIIGASGRTGVECIRQLAKHSYSSQIHAFCRDSNKLDAKDKKLCASIVQGDARNAQDLERALAETHANIVIVSIGVTDPSTKTDIRTASAQALVSVLKKPAYQQVQVIIVSTVGAGSSRMVIGLGFGKLLEFYLRRQVADHSGQEAAFDELDNRTLVVRATGLTSNEATGKLAFFGDKEKCPTVKTDRADLASWIVEEICDETKPLGGRVVNVTSVKKQ